MTGGDPLKPNKPTDASPHRDSPFDPLESWPAVPRCVPSDGLDPVKPQSLDEIFEGTDSLRILRRIVEGDPLGLERLVLEALDDLAVMFQPARLLAATQARCAWRGAVDVAPTERSFREWFSARLSEAMESLTQEDWSEERLGLPSDPLDERYLRSMGPFELPANHARRVALLFNQTAAKVRRPLYAVLVKNRPMAKVAEAFGLQIDQLKTLTFDCLASFGSTDARNPVDPDDATDWEGDM